MAIEEIQNQHAFAQVCLISLSQMYNILLFEQFAFAKVYAT